MLATNFAKDNKAAAKAGRQAEKSAELFSRRPRMKIFEEEDWPKKLPWPVIKARIEWHEEKQKGTITTTTIIKGYAHTHN